MKREVRQVTPEDVKKMQTAQVRMKEFRAINVCSSDSEVSEVAFDPKKINLKMAEFVQEQQRVGDVKGLFFPAIRDAVQKERDALLLKKKSDHSWYRDAIDPAPKDNFDLLDNFASEGKDTKIEDDDGILDNFASEGKDTEIKEDNGASWYHTAIEPSK